MALLERFSSLRVVLIINKGYKTLGWRAGTSTPVPFCLPSLLGPPPQGASEPELRPSHSHSSLLHTPELPHQQSHRQPLPSSFYCILFYFILSGTHGRPIDFDPQISVSRDRSLSRPGEVTETSVYSLSQRKTERREKEQRCNKCGVRDDRACDLMFSPLRFLSFFVVRGRFLCSFSPSVATGFLMSLLLPAACRPSLGSRQRSWRSQSDSGL